MPDNARSTAVRRGAEAAVLTRLWGALVREPIAGLAVHDASGGAVEVKLPDGRTLRGSAEAARPFAVPVASVSIEGVAYTDPAALLVELDLPGAADRLAAELRNSVDNLALARSVQPTPDGGPSTLDRAAGQPDPLAYLEQSVVDGHPLHPCCRTRIGLSPDEVRAYAPEHRAVVALRVVDVPPRRWHGTGAPVLWLHPWQADRVLGEHPWLRDTGRTVAARPLLGLRTLSLVDRPDHHVKTAVGVQMTSAVRTISAAAIHNGPAVTGLLLSLADRVPGLSVLPEVSAGAAIVEGAPCPGLAVVHRRLPALAPGELALPLAVLSAPSPADGRPVLTELTRDPLAFVADLAGVLLPPLLRLLDLGIALEAHGQNLLLVVRDGRPVRLLYRDLGGVRISPARLAHHGIQAPPLLGDIPNDDPEVLRTKLFASAVSTVLAELVTIAGREFGVDEALAWDRVAAVARAHGATGLFAETLPLKATTAMRLAEDPLADLWTEVDNPMAGPR